MGDLEKFVEVMITKPYNLTLNINMTDEEV